MANILIVDVCNLKRRGGLSGPMENAINIIVQKAINYSGFSKIELVVDSYSNRVERSVVFDRGRNIECIFTPRSADAYILDTVARNEKSGEYQKVTVVTSDNELRRDILFEVRLQQAFNLEFLGALDFLNGGKN